jgi:hypothetical protein
MADADRIYSLGTMLDPFDGNWPPTDTGSSGLGVAKAAQQLGLGGEYRWLRGVDEVVQTVVDGTPVSVGARWYNDMFTPDAAGFVTPTGGIAGGHQWTVHGYDLATDSLLGRCWWGPFRDFRITREHLGELLEDDGDAHIQARA